MKKTFAILFLILGISFNAFSQDKPVNRNTAIDRAPVINQTDNNGNSSVLNYGARWFGQNAGATSFWGKGFLNTAAAVTNFGASTTNLYGAMEFDNNGVLYAIAVALGSPLITVDTTTGNVTTLGAITGTGSDQILGMSFNPVNNKMYITGINGTTSDNLYTLDLTTRVATLIGGTGQNMFDIGINSTGQCYAISVLDNLLSVNLTSGVATTIGPIGFDANFIQGICFDRSTDTLWYAAYNSTAGAGQLRTVNLTTGNTTLIGTFNPAAEVCGFAIIGKKAYPLSAFNLLTPAAGTRVVTVAGSSTPVIITWDTSASGATYKWIFGNPVVPPRRITIPASNNSIVTTLGALDAVLAANGFTNNGSASDSAVGQWDVWAYKSPSVTGPDSLKSSNGPRAITLKRQQVSLNPFALSSPASGVRYVTSPVDASLINFIWTKAASGASYKWLYKTGATYTDPATLRISSNNAGLDSMLTLRNSQLDSILAGIGVASGDSITGVWRVRAYSSSDSLNSTAPDRAITFRRAGLLPLDQDFVDPSFPPPFWGLDAGGGTQYWTRNDVGGYQTGVGSAKYDFWTAGTATPLQTLTSNQFPAVTAPNNYLRFNYTQAFYLSGTALANDSCIIETSTNNGSTWTRLIGMGASQTLSSGVNSNAIMSTVGGPFAGAFTPTAANQWATKVYAMPVGTNKVRFVAKSDFGNNLYIDRITSGLITGIGNTPLSLVPDNYELSQNYPNPFNPETQINFSIPKQSVVTLKIFDILGKEVATLVNETKPAGFYNIKFNAGNFSSGVYFYKIEAGNFTDIKRMMLIK